MDASKVLDAMLRNAQRTSGKSSKCYTTCAICACHEIHEQVNLARTWFIYLLWPFTARTYQPSDLVSGQATPTIDDTDTYGSLQVNQRDGYRCIISGVWDGAHKPASIKQGWVTLQAAHILKWAVGVFTMDQAHTAAATWNIIRHYSGMSEETIQNMERLVDNSSNGMMLEYNIHNIFDKLKVYLEQTERENKYTVKDVGGRLWIHPLELLGISRILHMSGASEIFAQIFDKYDGAAGGNIGSLKSNGDLVHQLSSMMSALFIGVQQWNQIVQLMWPRMVEAAQVQMGVFGMAEVAHVQMALV
ncbi:hypothetical protein BDR07DRAFT_1381420 [Suillus spraguei]|nr:hypothetical protein BDR07DRAFT_1381420 [Suillus spraguei]